ncbi:MAG: ABC transporter permease [Woeseiaceae bacterium]|nr:ABC transporter permease [Woeseiaceae bacterium]
MLRNYLKIALRNIAGNPLFSAINIIGLSIGLACCILITLYVRYETSYDKHWQNADRIHRVTRDFFSNNLRLANIAPPIAPLLKQDFPEIEDITRLLRLGNTAMTIDERTIIDETAIIADTNVFEFFNLEFVQGNPDTALARPSNIVVSERAADRLFGSDDPMGKTINVAGQADMTVTGVFRDLPDNSHMAFEMVISIDVIPLVMGADELESWGSNNYFTYLRLPPGYDPADLEAKFEDFIIRHRGEDAPNGTAINLQALTDIHLTSNRDSEWRANGSLSLVYTFSAVALVVLLIACVNFMNLTTARSTQRAKEVGIRKVVGADRSQLIAQFLGESILLTALAMLLAVALVELLLPSFSGFLEKSLTFSIADPSTLGTLLLGTVVVGLLAGSYPAFYLSRFQPAVVLKGGDSGTGSTMLRRALVVFQFATSIALLIATGVVMAQMHYARTLDLGFDKERNLVHSLPYFVDLWELYTPLKAELETHPDILSVVYSSRVPSQQNLDGGGYIAAGTQEVMENIMGISDIKVDWQWFDHYDVEFLAGRPFRENEMRIEQPTEDNPVVNAVAILNESAARRFGWTPEEAIGKVIRELRNSELTMWIDREVVGVIPDIHFSSLHDEMKATIYAEPNPNFQRHISVKLAPGDPGDAIRHFEDVWTRLVPNDPPNWQFLDDRFDARYRAEAKQAQMFAVFAAFAIFVATLGLFGLASFTTERRTKEIGIRKVMGASAPNIIVLLTSDFTKLVVLANVIAWPVAYYFMSQWLTRFVYKAPFGEWAWLFLASAVVAIGVAWLTIALQAGRAAAARPVGALRYE